MGRYPSGQRGLTVNQLAQPSVVRIRSCPPWECWVTVGSHAARGDWLNALLIPRVLARVAQAVEPTLGKGVVKGSSPFAGSRVLLERAFS
jgi:hypothetical protein